MVMRLEIQGINCAINEAEQKNYFNSIIEKVVGNKIKNKKRVLNILLIGCDISKITKELYFNNEEIGKIKEELFNGIKGLGGVIRDIKLREQFLNKLADIKTPEDFNELYGMIKKYSNFVEQNNKGKYLIDPQLNNLRLLTDRLFNLPAKWHNIKTKQIKTQVFENKNVSLRMIDINQENAKRAINGLIKEVVETGETKKYDLIIDLSLTSLRDPADNLDLYKKILINHRFFKKEDNGLLAAITEHPHLRVVLKIKNNFIVKGFRFKNQLYNNSRVLLSDPFERFDKSVILCIPIKKEELSKVLDLKKRVLT